MSLPKPNSVITYQVKAFCKRQFLKNGMCWSSCQMVELRCQVPSVMVSLPSTGLHMQDPKGGEDVVFGIHLVRWHHYQVVRPVLK